MALLLGPPEDHCCYGYAMDLLVNLAQQVNFTFDLELQELYGEVKRVSMRQLNLNAEFDDI